MYFTPTVMIAFADFLHFDEDVIVYDCETTGLTPVQRGSEPACHIIQLSAIRLPHLCVGGFGAPIAEREWYIRPVESVPDKIAEMTGITDEFMADKPTEDEAYDEIREFFGNAIVAGYNNRGFDDHFMEEMYKRHGDKFEPFMSLDMYPISQQMVSPREVKNYKLATIAAYYGYGEEAFHDASADARVTMELMKIYADELDRREEETGSMMPDYSAGIKVRVTGVSRYERGQIRRIYVNTTDRNVAFYMDTGNLGWACADKNMSTDRFNMPDVVSQALRAAHVGSERELAQFGKPAR